MLALLFVGFLDAFIPFLGFVAILGFVFFLMLRIIFKVSSLRIPYTDRDEFVYRMTELLSKMGFRQGSSTADTVVFEPGALEKFSGARTFELNFDQPGSVRLTALSKVLSRIKHNFKGATEERYSGPAHVPMKNLFKIGGVLVGTGLLLAGGLMLFGTGGNASAPSSSSAVSDPKLDMEQQLYITGSQAQLGGDIPLDLTYSNRPITVHIPANTMDGTRLRLKGKGLHSPDGGASGDLVVSVHVK